MQWRTNTENFSHVANDYVTFCHTHNIGQSTQKQRRAVSIEFDLKSSFTINENNV